jgi:hypothetical protein
MKPAIPPLDSAAIPAELRDIQAWIGRRLVQRDDRWSKEPVNIHNGAIAETITLLPGVIFKRPFRATNVGAVMAFGLCRNNDLAFLDLDGVLDSTGVLKPFSWASTILSTVEGRAYIEKSATGTGASECFAVLVPGYVARVARHNLDRPFGRFHLQSHFVPGS